MQGSGSAGTQAGAFRLTFGRSADGSRSWAGAARASLGGLSILRGGGKARHDLQNEALAVEVERNGIGLFAGYSFPQGGKRGKPGIADEPGRPARGRRGCPLPAGGGADQAAERSPAAARRTARNARWAAMGCSSSARACTARQSTFGSRLSSLSTRTCSSTPPEPSSPSRRPTLPSAAARAPPSRSPTAPGISAAASAWATAARRSLSPSGARASVRAARADGRHEASRRRGDEQEHRARRRLLQRLQQRVGGVDVELVGLIDDDDAPAVAGGAMRQERAQPAHLVDRNAGGKALGLHVVGTADDQQPRMRQRPHLPRWRSSCPRRRDLARMRSRSSAAASAARAKR